MPIEPKRWAPGIRHDAQVARLLAEYTDIRDGLGWMKVVDETRKRVRSRSFRRLVTAISHELERVEIVLQPELIELTERTENDDG
jgi:hypothetical protein